IHPNEVFVQVENVPSLSLGDIRRFFGGQESWQRVSRKVTYSLHGRQAVFTLDSSTVTLQSKDVFLETPVRWWTGQAYVPLSLVATREFQELTGASVRWDAAGRLLSVEPEPGVSSPRFFSFPDKSRVVLDLNPRVHHRVLNAQQKRIAIRFYGGRPRSSERIEVKDGLIEAIDLKSKSRSGELIVTLSESAGPPEIRLEESPRQLVVEVRALLKETAGPAAVEGLPLPVAPPLALPAPAVKLPLPEGTRPSGESILGLSPIKTIVIDPGHGGKDAGAVGPHGALEKDVNLEIARTLARILEKEDRFRVILTRRDDVFIPLRERTKIANEHEADLFISIHCNASLTRKSNGFEIYFVSEKATDDEAAAVARRENAVVELEGLTGKAMETLQEVFWSMARTETLNESSEMAALVSHQAGRRLTIPNRGVKQASFYVLRGAKMPAVLVECGFITHKEEEGILRSRRFQNKLVDSLFAGLLDYEKRKIQAKVAARSAKAAPAEGGN
ncbi:MAG: N-acetylmuramoyl-L-alanine amidase, partial [Elusimicrobia bacterium]|nr:N-acetylmuramoyl-L-alanine amidase [Elusimicrobiota bacterium]